MKLKIQIQCQWCGKKLRRIDDTKTFYVLKLQEYYFYYDTLTCMAKACMENEFKYIATKYDYPKICYPLEIYKITFRYSFKRKDLILLYTYTTYLEYVKKEKIVIKNLDELLNYLEIVKKDWYK